MRTPSSPSAEMPNPKLATIAPLTPAGKARPLRVARADVVRAVAIPAAMLTATLAGCGRDTSMPTAPSDPPALARASTGAKLPAHALKGHCETVLAPTEFLRPGVIRQVDTGTCQLSHLGRTEFYSDKVILTFAGTQTTQATFTAANGDVLYAVGRGTNAPSGPGRTRFTATLTFIGGTGRFEHATGEARVQGESNLATRTAALTLVGWLDYDASDRSGR